MISGSATEAFPGGQSRRARLKPLKGKKNFENVFLRGKRIKGKTLSATVAFAQQPPETHDKPAVSGNYGDTAKDCLQSGNSIERSGLAIPGARHKDPSGHMDTIAAATGAESKEFGTSKSSRMDPGEIACAVSVSKKISKKAVVRNRIKRLMRESLRKAMTERPDYFLWNGMVVFFWRIPVSKPQRIKLGNVYPEMLEALRQISKEPATRDGSQHPDR